MFWFVPKLGSLQARPSCDLQVCTRHLASLHQQVQHLRILQQQVQHFDMVHYFFLHLLAAGMSLCRGSSLVYGISSARKARVAWCIHGCSCEQSAIGLSKGVIIQWLVRIKARNLQNTQCPQMKRRLVSCRFSSYRPNSYRHNKLSKLFRTSRCMVWYSRNWGGCMYV